MKQTAIVLCGLPGAGKSTWAEENAQHLGAVVVTTDEIRTEHKDPKRAINAALARVRHHLKAGSSVIVDVCALRRLDRGMWRTAARVAGVPTRLVVFATDLETCRARDATRPAGIRYSGNWEASAGYLDEVLASRARGEGFDSVEIVGKGKR
ncbi:MAG: ATP-binding protein [Deltaproteobacteria bacterium]|nr:ATP-binding protein [Deltaproteobacteria bacterium]